MRISLNITFSLFLGLGVLVPVNADETVVDLTTIDRTIIRQPVYQAQPSYALLVFGLKGERRAWLVVDGQDVAYLDHNGNGDLTDPEDRVPLDLQPTRKLHGRAAGDFRTHVFPLGQVFGEELEFYLSIRRPLAGVSEDPPVSRKSREFVEKQCVSGFLNRILMKPTKTQAVSPLLLTSNPEIAQISHIHGVLAVGPVSEVPLELAPWPIRSHLQLDFGWQNLPAKDCHDSLFLLTHLAPGEAPANVHPFSRLMFPSRSTEPLLIVQSVTLERDPKVSVLHGLFRPPEDFSGEEFVVDVQLPADAGLPFQRRKFRMACRRAIADQTDGLFVMFRDSKLSMKQAVHALRKRGLEVNVESDRLEIRKEGLSPIDIRLVSGKDAQDVATAIGLNTEFADTLSGCHCQFEVRFLDSKKWLDEQQTLVTIQESLQQVTRGVVYRTWDKRLIALPELHSP